MPTYNIYLKSHSDAPDYEDSVTADTKKDAVDYFYKKLGKLGWDKKTLTDNIEKYVPVWERDWTLDASGKYE